VTDSLTVQKPGAAKSATITATENGVKVEFNGRKVFGDEADEEEISADVQADKPLMIFFTADWCGPCRKLKAETLADPAVKVFLAENVTELVANENKPLMKKHGVTGFPTLVFFRADRTEAGRIVGYHGKDEFLAKCKKILGK
jgi:thioredoxin 1